MNALGRHVEHDERSRAFAVAAAAAPLKSVLHLRHVPIFDQGDLGSCTGNAAAGCMATGPWKIRTSEKTAVQLYERATQLDSIAGAYPPDDTGSSGLAVMKAVRERGWITGYHHAFSMHAALIALQHTPVIVGVNWYEGFDRPDAHGLLSIAGSVRGGHEPYLLGCDVDAHTVRGANSWGPDWADHGYFEWTWDVFDRLLHEQGDVTVPVA